MKPIVLEETRLSNLNVILKNHPTIDTAFLSWEGKVLMVPDEYYDEILTILSKDTPHDTSSNE